MEFEERIKEFSKRLENLKSSITTEEATKTSLIMPFFQILGYDIFNPNEFMPEYTADVGIKKGEKVDYAISINNTVSILIEAKSITESLNKHSSQLFRYFGTTNSKLAILTNGVFYKFYTDLENQNKMDLAPFLEIDLLNLKDTDIVELKKFAKENFDIENIINAASNLKYASSIEKVLSEEFSDPSDDFIKMILNKGVYDGLKTQNVIDKYRPILKKSVNFYINNLVNERIQNALKSTTPEINSNEDTTEHEDAIITTEEEMESYYIVKSILTENVEPNKIFFKDTYSYFGILYDNKVTKWVCRVYLRENSHFIIIPDENKTEVRFDINSIQDIYKYKKELLTRLDSLMNN